MPIFPFSWRLANSVVKETRDCPTISGAFTMSCNKQGPLCIIQHNHRKIGFFYHRPTEWTCRVLCLEFWHASTRPTGTDIWQKAAMSTGWKESSASCYDVALPVPKTIRSSTYFQYKQEHSGRRNISHCSNYFCELSPLYFLAQPQKVALISGPASPLPQCG